MTWKTNLRNNFIPLIQTKILKSFFERNPFPFFKPFAPEPYAGMSLSLSFSVYPLHQFQSTLVNQEFRFSNPHHQLASILNSLILINSKHQEPEEFSQRKMFDMSNKNPL